MGFSPFARRYLGNRIRFLFLALLRCFSSGGAPLKAYVFAKRSHPQEKKIQISKLETRNNFQNTNFLMAKTFLNFGILRIRICFGFRASDFEFPCPADKGLLHSEITGSKLARQLTGTYRSPLRPSSVCCTKASIKRINLPNSIQF